MFTLRIPECSFYCISLIIFMLFEFFIVMPFFCDFCCYGRRFLCFWMLVLGWYILKCCCLFSVCFVIITCTAESLNAVVFQTCVRISWWCSFTFVIVTAMAFKFQSCFESFCGDCFLLNFATGIVFPWCLSSIFSLEYRIAHYVFWILLRVCV